MRSKKYLGLIIIVLIFGWIFIPKIVDRLQSSATVSYNRLNKAEGLRYIKINSEPKKIPSFLFLNQDSLYVGNEDFLGKVTVVEFFFTTCPSICPIMNKNMKILEQAFGDRQDFAIASITIDPETDTPSQLKRYAENYEVFSPNWHFLTGDNETIYELANKGFNIFAEVNPSVAGGFEHQGYFALIDKEGYFRSRSDKNGNPIVYYLGIDDELAEVQGVEWLKIDIEKLLKE